MALPRHVIQARQQLRSDLLVWLYERLPMRRNHAGYFPRELESAMGASDADIELALWSLSGNGDIHRDGQRTRITTQGALTAERIILQTQENPS